VTIGSTILAVILPLAVFAVLVTVLVLLLRPSRTRAEAWRRAADEVGMVDTQLITDVILHMSGRIGGRRITVDDTSAQGGQHGSMPATEIVVSGGLPADLLLRAEVSILGIVTTSGGVSLGDQDFDSRIRVAGDLAVASAVLDHDTRRDLPHLLQHGSRLDAGRLHIMLDDRVDDSRVLRTAIETALDLADRLTPPEDLSARLGEIGCSDPVAGVRRTALAALVEHDPAGPISRDALRRALGDADPEVRITAASAVGSEGLPSLIAVAGDPATAPATAARAVLALGSDLPLGLADRLLDRAREESRRELALAVAHGLGRVGDDAAIARLSELLEREDTLACAAADALGATGSPSAETPLLASVERGSAKLRHRAVVALGQVGTVAAVPALREALAAHSLDRGLREAARAATAEIQSRLDDAEAGQLSLSTREGGELALADELEGSVSLEEDGNFD
jgi:hypothetical protein